MNLPWNPDREDPLATASQDAGIKSAVQSGVQASADLILLKFFFKDLFILFI